MVRQFSEPRIRILRRREVERMVALSRSAIYRQISESTFPKPVPLGGGADAHAVGWIEAEVIAWLAACVAKRDEGSA